MLDLSRSNLAHIFDSDTALSGWWITAIATIAALLIIEHHVVAGFSRERLTRRMRIMSAIAVMGAVVAVIAPVSQGAFAASTQSSEALLPDLISDPPNPSFFNELNTPDGRTRLVVTFDGYVHNIGEGALDVVGNPQEIDGMRQRVQNGGEWEDVGAPTVRFETDDGHNHFHLIEAIEYVLWNEFQGSQTAIGSKVGFCLVDSEQMEPGYDQSYSEEGDKFCQEDNPQATELRMGITSGWRDIYDATTTLQWVDVSNVAPGRYWIGAITDPNDEILESNEDNNALIFSDRTISVPGFSPRTQPPVPVTEPVVEFELESVAHGNVTSPVYVIEQGPTSGSLDVPIGADLGSPTVRYFPEPGFEGTDELVFSVHDAASPYPFDHPTQTLTLNVASGAGDDALANDPTRSLEPAIVSPSTFFESELGAAFSVDIQATSVDGDPARVFATGLPTGLVADADSGTISGVAAEEGIFAVQIVAVGDRPEQVAVQDITWIVNPSQAGSGLADVLDQSSPRGELTRVRLGTNALGATFEAEGLPPGLEIEDTSPVITGSPTEVGTYQVTARQSEGNTVTAEATFSWTIRPTTAIDFVL